MKKKIIAFLLFLCFIVGAGSLKIYAAAPTTVAKDSKNYNLVSSTADVTDGNYLISDISGVKFMGALSGKFHTQTNLTDAIVFTIETTENGKTIKNSSNNKYLACSVAKTNLELDTADDTAKFDIVVDNDGALITTKKVENGKLLYNVGSPRFLVYTSNPTTSMQKVSLYKETASSSGEFTVSFNANGGTFAEGKGTTVTTTTGQTASITLPVAADLTTTAYKYTTLKAWSDGTNTYNPGDTVSLTAAATFTAVYEAPENITVAQALEIADITKGINTTINFSMNAVVVSKTKNSNKINYVLKDLETESTIQAYDVDEKGLTYVGDVVKAFGPIIKYGNKTSEFNSGTTISLVSAKAASEFVLNETKTSLKVEYVSDDSDTLIDTAIRFGGIITEASYRSDAKYGVLVSSTEIVYTAGETTYASVEDFILAMIDEDKNIENVECTPAKVDGGYQFAWVIDNVEGHYNDTLYAVMYMEYNGKLYLCVSKNASVVSASNEYITRSEELGLTADDVVILNKIAGNE